MEGGMAIEQISDLD